MIPLAHLSEEEVAELLEAQKRIEEWNAHNATVHKSAAERFGPKLGVSKGGK